jgi:chaperonin GroES
MILLDSFISYKTIMTKLIPIEDHILIEPAGEESTTKSGIVLTDASKEKPGKGTVIAVGAGRILENGQRSAMDVKEGDIVHFTKYAPDEIEVWTMGDKKKYLVVKHSSILAIEK